MVASLWESKQAENIMLVHPHAIDFVDQDVSAILERINPSLNNARARDVANVQHAAAAEALSKELNSETPADAAKLLYLSSLAIGPNALQGFAPEEIAAHLCAPGRDVSTANDALVIRLEEACWYLHRRTDGRWHYRNVKNVGSAIRDRAEIMNPDARRKEVETYLRKSFDPAGSTLPRVGEQRNAYQKLLVFPTIDDIRAALGAHEAVLVISQPSYAGLNPELKRFWENETWRNRLMFLCGSETFTEVSRAAAYMKAAQDQIKEFTEQRMSDLQPEMQQAHAMLDRHTTAFHSALRETFTQLHFPDVALGKLEMESLRLEFAGNGFVGQLAILDTLKDQRKFRADVESDDLRAEFETFIFTAQTASWRDLIETAARRPEWYFLPPGGHETMKSVAIRKDVWRDEGGGYLRKGPFPKEKTSPVVTRIGRDDKTGMVTFQVNAKHGDRMHYEEGGAPATINSPIVQNGRLQTSALKISFLAVDSTGEHETGEPRNEENPITLKYDYVYRDGSRRVMLKAVPTGTIRYSLDGSNPRNGGVCDGGEIIVPEGRDVLLAIVEAQGIWSEQLRVDVPRAAAGPGGADYQPDPQRPAEWRRRLVANDRGRAFKIIECLKRHRASAAGTDITVSVPGESDDYIAMSFGPNIIRAAEQLEAVALGLIGQLTGGAADVRLVIPTMRFPSGTALLEAAKELQEPLKGDEVRQ
jgi:hypothetical protein